MQTRSRDLITTRRNPRIHATAKRIMDLAAAGSGLLLLSPLMALIALAIVCDSNGGAVYRQQRIGRGLKPFELLKFRTMTVGSDRSGKLLTVGDDPRVTRIGRILRRTKLDELPQLINVIKGEMSLVGPRPEVPCYVREFRDDFCEILAERPGITDFASIRFRNESELLAAADDPEQEYRTRILPEKILLAKEYLRRSSIVLDIAVIVSTLRHLVKPGPVHLPSDRMDDSNDAR